MAPSQSPVDAIFIDTIKEAHTPNKNQREMSVARTDAGRGYYGDEQLRLDELLSNDAFALATGRKDVPGEERTQRRLKAVRQLRKTGTSSWNRLRRYYSANFFSLRSADAITDDDYRVMHLMAQLDPDYKLDADKVILFQKLDPELDYEDFYKSMLWRSDSPMNFVQDTIEKEFARRNINVLYYCASQTMKDTESTMGLEKWKLTMKALVLWAHTWYFTDFANDTVRAKAEINHPIHKLFNIGILRMDATCKDENQQFHRVYCVLERMVSAKKIRAHMAFALFLDFRGHVSLDFLNEGWFATEGVTQWWLTDVHSTYLVDKNKLREFYKYLCDKVKADQGTTSRDCDSEASELAKDAGWTGPTSVVPSGKSSPTRSAKRSGSLTETKTANPWAAYLEKVTPEQLREIEKESQMDLSTVLQRVLEWEMWTVSETEKRLLERPWTAGTQRKRPRQ